MNAELKRRVVHALGKYVLNVPDKLLFAAGLGRFPSPKSSSPVLPLTGMWTPSPPRFGHIIWKASYAHALLKNLACFHTHGRAALLWHLPLLAQFFFASRRGSEWLGVR